MMATAVSVSQETENYWRAIEVVLNEVPTRLRSYFVQNWNQKYPNSHWDNTAASGRFFFQNESSQQKSFLNQGKNRNIRDLILAGNCMDWDSTTLFYTLLYSSHRLLPAVRQISQRIPPLSISEWIDLLREKRNQIAHSHVPTLSRKDFNDLLTNVKQAFSGLGFPLHALTQLESGVLTTADMQRLRLRLDDEGNRFDELEEMIKNTEDDFSKRLQKTDSSLVELVSRQVNLEAEINEIKEQNTREKSGSTLNIEEIKDNVREHYKTCEMPFFPIDWSMDCLKELTDLYIQLELVQVRKYESSRQTSGYKYTCTIYDSFDSQEDCRDPRKILWVGEAGIGKTTSCKKLALDFSEDVGDFSKKFPDVYLLIFLRCRELEGQFLHKILELLLAEPVNEVEEKHLQSWLTENASSILFLIDSLDELSCPNKELEALLQGKLFRGSRIIVTSRREGLKGQQRYFDSVFTVRGFSTSDVQNFVEKYFETLSMKEKTAELAQSLQQKLKKNEYLSDLSKLPLCLLILCVIWEEHGGFLPDNMADLYDSFLNCIIDRYLSKHSDIIRPEDEIRSNVIDILSRIAYTTLERQVSYFEQRELKEVIGTVPGLNETDGISLINRIGLVTIDKSGSKLSRCCYEFFHKSFQEFFCALFVKKMLESSSPKEKLNLCNEYSWLLDLRTEPATRKIFWSNRRTVLFLFGILNREEFKVFINVAVKIINRLHVSGWEMALKEISDCICELSTERLLEFGPLIGDALPCEIEPVVFQGKILDVISGPLKRWAFTKFGGVLTFTSEGLCSLESKELMELTRLVLNQSSKVRELKLILSGHVPIDIVERISWLWWSSLSLSTLYMHFEEVLFADWPTWLRIICDSQKEYKFKTVLEKEIKVIGGGVDNSDSRKLRISYPGERYASLSTFMWTSDDLIHVPVNDIFFKLIKATYLQKLTLAGIPVRYFSTNGICEFIKKNKALKSLSFNHCDVSDAVIKEIADALKVNITLKELSLCGNNCRFGGAERLGSMLKKNKTLKTLDLSDNALGESAVMLIMKATSKNKVKVIL